MLVCCHMEQISYHHYSRVLIIETCNFHSLGRGGGKPISGKWKINSSSELPEVIWQETGSALWTTWLFSWIWSDKCPQSLPSNSSSRWQSPSNNRVVTLEARSTNARYKQDVFRNNTVSPAAELYRVFHPFQEESASPASAALSTAGLAVEWSGFQSPAHSYSGEKWSQLHGQFGLFFFLGESYACAPGEHWAAGAS